MSPSSITSCSKFDIVNVYRCPIICPVTASTFPVDSFVIFVSTVISVGVSTTEPKVEECD